MPLTVMVVVVVPLAGPALLLRVAGLAALVGVPAGSLCLCLLQRLGRRHGAPAESQPSQWEFFKIVVLCSFEVNS